MEIPAFPKTPEDAEAPAAQAVTPSPQALSWEKVYIFISSTFNDMHAERDFLVKPSLPAPARLVRAPPLAHDGHRPALGRH